ncbi:M56 family metallopeptidase [Zobellia russellii]|uniref:M56 family metallopeptidase n=1 Tax=Zobellia russellii TaxID=248907 RepID=UPI001BFFD1B2|nr:M56 family metallopeptidase [Zobellia russellii]MBT9188103.1 M56 family metallopeptidase [Zobellia russellii]
MIQYILECIAFQLVFLVIYDFFLKRETFFQWNRFYLLSTFLLSLVLPFIKIEAFKTTVEQPYIEYGEEFWGVNNALVVGVQEPTAIDISWQMVLFVSGALVATLLLVYKLRQLYLLSTKGDRISFKEFTQILIPNSNMAFSFFKSIFIGDKVSKTDYTNIIAHELVHIKQGHSWDLLFFELMRIVGWFNPLVYVYQNRISELHEFIADAKVAKNNKNEQYQLLLSQVFQTQNISFINHFFKSSLIKKRIVMLQKSQSKSVFKLKYLALVPLILGMLFYTSCENDDENSLEDNENIITVSSVDNLSEEEETKVYARLRSLADSEEAWSLKVEDSEISLKLESTKDDVFVSGINNEPIRAKMTIDNNGSPKYFKNFTPSAGEPYDWKKIYREENLVPFSYVDKVPVFPGCEGEADVRACFQQNIQKHISKHFKYPEEAQRQGIQGRVSIMFTIDEDGSIVDIRKRGPHELLENEAVRIIEKLPRMTPGSYEGKIVKVPFSIPIFFRLEQAGFNPFSVDANYVQMQQEQIAKLSTEAQMAYGNSVAFRNVDNPPVFPGCENADDILDCFKKSMYRHISKNFRYPENAQERGVQGRVSVIFLMDTSGNITHISTRGPDESLEKEARRIIAKLPQIIPGRHNGKQVNVPYAIPITFRLR